MAPPFCFVISARILLCAPSWSANSRLPACLGFLSAKITGANQHDWQDGSTSNHLSITCYIFSPSLLRGFSYRDQISTLPTYGNFLPVFQCKSMCIRPLHNRLPLSPGTLFSLFLYGYIPEITQLTVPLSLLRLWRHWPWALHRGKNAMTSREWNFWVIHPCSASLMQMYPQRIKAILKRHFPV